MSIGTPWPERLACVLEAEAILVAMDAGGTAVFERRRELWCEGGDQVLTMLVVACGSNRSRVERTEPRGGAV
jgi:hypothetical protein